MERFVSSLIFLSLFLSASPYNKLIVVLIDGFRWDYFRIPDLPGLQAIKSRGVKANYIIPEYPSSSYPNHYSLMTGLHTESHGMISDIMLDPKYGTFNGWKNLDSELNPGWWNRAEPLWISATRQDRRSVLFNWLGCQVELRQLRPRYCRRYVENYSLKEVRVFIDEAIKAMRKDSAEFAAIRIADVDTAGHQYGPLSKGLNDTVRLVDKEISHLLKRLKETNLDKSTNLVVLSDHGMATIGGPERYIKLTDYVPNIDDLTEVLFNMYSYVLVWPKSGALEQIYKGFKGKHHNLHTYHKDEIPKIWNYKTSDRIPPLLLVTEPGWIIVNGYGPKPGMWGYKETGPARGLHGYDPTDMSMAAMFLAMGPDIKKGIDVDSFHIVDIYNLLCKLLGILPSPNNGTWSKVANILTEYSPSSWPYEQPLLPSTLDQWIVEPPLPVSNNATVIISLATLTGFILVVITIVCFIRPRHVIGRSWSRNKPTRTMRYSEVIKSGLLDSSEDEIS